MANDKAPVKAITPEAILSYPHLLEPREDDSGNLWYDCSLVFLPGEDGTPPDLKGLKAAVLEAAKAKFGANAVQMIKDGDLKLPFRTDAKKKGYPEGSVFFSAKSKAQPGIVGIHAGKDGKPAPYTGEVFAGLRVKASVRPYYYKQQGGGIAMGLGNLQVLGPSQYRFDGRMAAEDEFEADANAAAAGDADLDDIL